MTLKRNRKKISSKKILTVVGARPQFVKAAMVSRALQNFPNLQERILHTGQHYDFEMSEIFFEEMEIPRPYKNLNVGSGQQGEQTAKMLQGIEAECLEEKPDLLLIYGDTNSTLAAALVGAKLEIPVFHVEAGLRSFNRSMPEEINRIVADRLSSLLFASTPTAVSHLKNEGITKGVHWVGDVMVDAIYAFRKRAQHLPKVKKEALLPSSPFFLLTLHRQENVDDPQKLSRIFKALEKSPLPILFPQHPRTKKTLQNFGLVLPPKVFAVPPVSYVEMIFLQTQAQAVFTDSGGIQKEAVVLGKPCCTLREETEWVETKQNGWNRLLGSQPSLIKKALQDLTNPKPKKKFPTQKFYGNGHTAEKIAKIISATPLEK